MLDAIRWESVPAEIEEGKDRDAPEFLCKVDRSQRSVNDRRDEGYMVMFLRRAARNDQG